MTAPNPYDELPYFSQPIEWTAPERLAVTSFLHRGPRPKLEGYRVLELGCGNGANIVPLAYYRRHAEFVGVDGSRDAVAAAQARKDELGLSNLDLIHCDFLTADDHLSGAFDFVIAHGVFSWVPPQERRALLELCAARLRSNGIVYLNYNARPGWDVRGLVRDFLLAQTANVPGLRRRAELAQEVAGQMASSLAAVTSDHPYTQLMTNEFRYVREGHLTYVAHEYLSPDNEAFWQSEFAALARRHGLVHVAEADFNYPSGRVSEQLAEQITAAGLVGRSADDTVDLLSFRQHRTAILAHDSWTPCAPSVGEMADLFVAASLSPVPSEKKDEADGDRWTFRHPSGFTVEARQEVLRSAFERLLPIWPRGLRAGGLLGDVAHVIDDLRLLQRYGMIELRLVEPADFEPSPAILCQHESRWGYYTTPHHTRQIVTPV